MGRIGLIHVDHSEGAFCLKNGASALTKNDLTVRHVVFDVSAAGALILALEKTSTNANERVLFIPDDLSFGPVCPLNKRIRRSWNMTELGYQHDEADFGYSDHATWAAATGSGAPIVAWLHRHSAKEYANFLQFLSALQEPVLSIADLTEIEPCRRNGQKGLGKSLSDFQPEQLHEIHFRGTFTHLDPKLRVKYLNSWAHLKQENSALRVIVDRELVSAPISFFDELLLSFIVCEWSSCSDVVLKTLFHGPYRQTDAYILWPRLLALASAQRIEINNSSGVLRKALVRRI